MGTISTYTDTIDKQIAFNSGKNICSNAPGLFEFMEETAFSFEDFLYLSPDSVEIVAGYAAEKALEEFCRVNQYFSFNALSKKELKNIYLNLAEQARMGVKVSDSLVSAHYRNLKEWLMRHNPFVPEMYKNAGEIVTPVPCLEYSAGLQLDILGIDCDKILEPVLDIGCGKQAQLVDFLRSKGIEAYGTDRFPFSKKYLITSDWLEFNYSTPKWGTIISHLGFSNHFLHHNLRADGNFIGYATTYMKILQSLKNGGTFHYAPALPFIESLLGTETFSTETREIGEVGFCATVIRRKK